MKDHPGTGHRRPVVPRADGSVQVGIGPGALVLRGAAEDAVVARLGAALGEHPQPTGHAPACAVLGHGPLATRLRAVLDPAAGGAPDPALTVHVHQHVVPLEVGVAVARDGRLHLPVVVQPRRVVVGPLVGRPGDPCLHCLDLHRTGRDPAWPELATWLGHPTAQVEPLPVPPDVLVATEGVVRLVVRSAPEDLPGTRGLTHEVGTSDPHLVTRRWRPHPACPWHDTRGRAAGRA